MPTKTEDAYWLTAARGRDACLNCTEPTCYYDVNDGGDCPIWLQTPIVPVSNQYRIQEALEDVRQVLLGGSITATDLIRILNDRGYYSNLVYYLIKKGYLKVEKVKMHKKSKQFTKIMVLEVI